MSRALIVGPRDDLERVIDTLYDLKVLHIVDHHEGEEELSIGRPLPRATEASEVLVKLRSIANVLQVGEPAKGATGEPVGADVKPKILALELNISEEDASKKKMQALVADLNHKIEEITPFAQLPLALADYRGYESLEVLVGKVPREIADLPTVTSEYESFETPGFLAVFVAKAHAAAMQEFLGQRGFASVAIPEGTESPRDILTALLAERERWEKRLAETDERLTTLRKRYASYLAAAKAHLEIEVEKAEAPLRFAVTDHTFVVEGWVPEDKFPEAEKALSAFPGVFLSKLEAESAHADGGEPVGEPPVLLHNPKPIKPFEMLVNMFGTPSYHEIDPTLVFSFAFPVMFGIMVGDAGYGLLWMVYGIWLLRRWKDRPWDFWKNLLVAFIWGGFWATIFGALFFGEAFGILFHAPPGATPGTGEFFNWSDNILHVSIPLYPVLDKLTQVPDFLIMSVSVAFLHLETGFVIGVLDDVRHSVKHAIGKVGWFLILFGLYVVIIVRASRWPGTWGNLIWNGPLGWFPRSGYIVDTMGFTAANPIPLVAAGMLGAGVVLMVATEGGLHAMEIFGLLANVISYARLAGIGVAEEAVIVSLNVIIIDALVLNGSILTYIVAIFLMGLCNLMMFLLSTISGTIQSVRLNYVEFFLKFYKGTGTLFRPFGVRTKSEV